MKVTVIGAGGHVGLPFSLVCAQAGHTVFGVDTNEKVVNLLNKGIVPYVEHGAEQLLKECLGNQTVRFTVNSSHIKESDVIAVMLGTPVDSENNPRLDDLFEFVDHTLIPFMKHGQLIMLRSTVSPGTTEVLRSHIETKTGMMEGVDFYLVFCPERVLQTKGIEETMKLPQVIGAFNDASYEKARLFNRTYNKSEQFFLSPREAEIGKLMCNMYRYVNFALANEFWMIGEKQGVNIDKVIDAVNYGYSRMDIPHPGPNVGGPCLFKDGRFLLSDIPFGDLIQTSFLINEGMPDYIFNRIKSYAGASKIKKVLILGASFKKGCDDTRNSLSFKMRKVCKKHGVSTFIDDPYVHLNPQIMYGVNEYDAVIVMTPHDTFLKTYPLKNFREDCIIADIWKLFPESEASKTGIYKVKDIRS